MFMFPILIFIFFLAKPNKNEHTCCLIKHKKILTDKYEYIYTKLNGVVLKSKCVSTIKFKTPFHKENLTNIKKKHKEKLYLNKTK